MIKIEQNTTLLTSSEFKEKISGKNNEFSEILAKVEQFKKDLEELGPLRLAFKLNMDKIKQKIEEKKVEPKKPSYDIDDDLPPIPVFLRRNRK